jgi:hypothetical protein
MEGESELSRMRSQESTAPEYVDGRSLGATEVGALHLRSLGRRKHMKRGAQRCLGGAG